MQENRRINIGQEEELTISQIKESTIGEVEESNGQYSVQGVQLF